MLYLCLFTTELYLQCTVQISLNHPLAQSCLVPWSRYKNCSLARCSWWEQGNRSLLVSHDTMTWCWCLALSSRQLEINLWFYPRLSMSPGILSWHSSLWTLGQSNLVYVAAVTVRCCSRETDASQRKFPCILSLLSRLGRANSIKIFIIFTLWFKFSFKTILHITSHRCPPRP